MHHRFIDEYSTLDSVLHKLDPRVKVFAFLGIILFVLLTPLQERASLLFYGFAILVLIKISRLPLRFIFLRSLAIAPFVILVAATFILSSRGADTLLFWTLLLKAYISILSMIIMVSTTKFASLLKVLEKMRSPALFIMIFSFLYRYIYLFLDEFMRMNMARQARTVRRRHWGTMNIFANMIGHLFIRSYETGEDVYLAMCSRGYQGRIKTLHQFALEKRDYIFLAVVFSYFLGVRILFFCYV